jgi:hypothetical protein
MLRTIAVSLLTLGSLAAFSPAQIVSIQTPRVSVKVGPHFIPGISVAVPGQVPPVVDPTPVAPPPRLVPPPPGDVVPIPAPVMLRPMTPQEFAACFQPTPGCHEALLIHPGSGCPVLVRFNLPPGCPKVCVHRRELTFNYGCQEVEIRFKLFGKVAVHYR